MSEDTPIGQPDSSGSPAPSALPDHPESSALPDHPESSALPDHPESSAQPADPDGSGAAAGAFGDPADSITDSGGAAGRSARSVAARRWVTLSLGVTAVLLLTLSVVLGLLYRTSADRDDQRRALATERAERDRLAAELSRATVARTELEKQLAKAKTTALDPAGYQRVKACVENTAKMERALAEANPDGAFTLPEGVLGAPPGSKIVIREGYVLGGTGTKPPRTCRDALPYLK